MLEQILCLHGIIKYKHSYIETLSWTKFERKHRIIYTISFHSFSIGLISKTTNSSRSRKNCNGEKGIIQPTQKADLEDRLPLVIIIIIVHFCFMCFD